MASGGRVGVLTDATQSLQIYKYHRVKSEIQKKEWVFEKDFYPIQDTLQWFARTTVDFSESNIGTDSCNVYVMEIDDKRFSVKKCTDTAYFSR